MWNFYIACTKLMASRANPSTGLSLGRRVWAARERVRRGEVTRPSSIPWASQPEVLEYDITHVVYVMIPKSGTSKLYVGVTSASAWTRLGTRMTSLMQGQGEGRYEDTFSRCTREVHSSYAR